MKKKNYFDLFEKGMKSKKSDELSKLLEDLELSLHNKRQKAKVPLGRKKPPEVNFGQSLVVMKTLIIRNQFVTLYCFASDSGINLLDPPENENPLEVISLMEMKFRQSEKNQERNLILRTIQRVLSTERCLQTFFKHREKEKEIIKNGKIEIGELIQLFKSDIILLKEIIHRTEYFDSVFNPFYSNALKEMFTNLMKNEDDIIGNIEIMVEMNMFFDKFCETILTPSSARRNISMDNINVKLGDSTEGLFGMDCGPQKEDLELHQEISKLFSSICGDKKILELLKKKVRTFFENENKIFESIIKMNQSNEIKNENIQEEKCEIEGNVYRATKPLGVLCKFIHSLVKDYCELFKREEEKIRWIYEICVDVLKRIGFCYIKDLEKINEKELNDEQLLLCTSLDKLRDNFQTLSMNFNNVFLILNAFNHFQGIETFPKKTLFLLRRKIVNKYLKAVEDFFVPDIITRNWASCKSIGDSFTCSDGLKLWEVFILNSINEIVDLFPNKQHVFLINEIIYKSIKKIGKVYCEINPSRIRKKIYEIDIFYMIQSIQKLRGFFIPFYLSKIKILIIQILSITGVHICPLENIINFLSVSTANNCSMNTRKYIIEKEEIDYFPDVILKPKKYSKEEIIDNKNKCLKMINEIEERCAKLRDLFTEKNIGKAWSKYWDKDLSFLCLFFNSRKEMIKFIKTRNEFNDEDYPELEESEKEKLEKLKDLLKKMTE